MFKSNLYNSVCFAPEGVVGPSASGVAGVASATPSASPPADSGAPSGANKTPGEGAGAKGSAPGGSQDTTNKKDDPEGFGEDFFSSMSEVEVEAAPEVPAPPPPKTVPAQEVPTVPDPKPAQPASPQEPKVTEPEAAKPGGEATASLPLHSPGELAQRMRENVAQLMPELEKTYVLSPEDVEALETDATTAVPKLLARVHFNAMTSILGNLQDIVPAMLAQQMTTYQSAQVSLDKFFSMHPQLDKVTHRDLVLQTGSMYRKMYPQAKPEDMMRDVGIMVALKAGMSPTGQVLPPSGGNGSRPPPASPFVPARGGGAAPPSNEPLNEWEGAYSNE